MNISSITIARDEEKNIKKCIESLQGIIDDIVVLVDSRTKDNTFLIASSFPNTKCEIVMWQGFSATKNLALTKTKYDWVLWIDADEELSTELKEELIRFKNSKPDFNSYYIPRKAFFLGKWIKHCGWYPGYVLRLFNKNYATFSENTVHERIIVKGKSGYFTYWLNHYTDPNINHYLNKLNNYTTLVAEEIFLRNKKITLLDILLRPISVFLKMYILKFGFLDGLHGLNLSINSAFYVFTKYCKVWELKNIKKKK